MNAVQFLNKHRNVSKRPAGGISNSHQIESQYGSMHSTLQNTSYYKSIMWRGHGGILPTPSDTEFDRQLDKISIWMECWSHQKTCCVLEEMLRHSTYTQMSFLNTVLQPSLHRDFMYTARSRFPEINFTPVSTHITRKLKNKLTRLRLDTFYRVSSAYRQTDEDIQQVKLPHEPDKSIKNYLISSDAISSYSYKDRQNYKNEIQSWRYCKSQNMNRWIGSDHIQSSDTSIVQDTVSRFIKMPVRRHIQNEQMMLAQQNKSSNASQSPTKCKYVQTKSSSSQSHVHYKVVVDKCESLANLSLTKLPEEAKQIIQWYSNEWNDTKRNEFLHKVLLKLDPRQHYFLSSLVSIKTYKDIVGTLPEKLALKIMKYLSPMELLVACQVSRKWKCIASTNKLWMSKCKEINLEVPVPPKPNWKDIFKNNLYLRVNWRKGLFRNFDLCGHTQSVLCVACEFPYLASGSMDKTIKIWNIETGQLQQTLTGHSGGVWCVQFFTKHLLISGSFDSTIRIWNLHTKKLTRILFGHTGQIWCLKGQGTLLVSGSQDKTAKIWNIGRCLLVHTLRGHSGAIFSVDVSNDCSLALTASADKSIRQWTTDTGELVKVICVSSTTSVMSVSYSQGYFACSYNGIVCLYQGDTLVRTFEEHLKRIECVDLKITNAQKGEGYIVSAGKDGLIKLWDTTRSNSVQTFNGHTKSIKSVYVSNTHIISASSDTKIRILDFNIGIPTDKNNEDDEELGDDDVCEMADN